MFVTDYNKTFKRTQTAALIIIIFLVALNITLFTLYILERGKERATYVVTDYGTFTAKQAASDQRLKRDAVNLIRMCFTHVFSHDKHTFHDRIEKGLQYLSSQEGKKIMNDFNSSGVYENYIKYSSRSTLQIDSIRVDDRTNPMMAYAYVKQKLHYKDKVKRKPFIAQMELHKTDRSRENPFGLYIDNLNYLNYQPKQGKHEKLGIK